jgi:hypothetical protein
MKSNEERLHFVLRFAEMKLDLLREGDWLNLKEDIMGFLGWFSMRQAEITLEAVTTLQSEVAEMLQGIVGIPLQAVADRGTLASSPGRQVYKRRRLKKARIVKIGDGRILYFDVTTVQRLAFDCSTPGELRLSVRAELRDSFFFALGVTLTKADLSRLRQCLTCTRLFYADHGRQQFCSPRCATTQRVKRFRKQQEEEASAIPFSPVSSSVRQKTRERAR